MIAWIDTETTGLNPETDQIISFAGVVTEGAHRGDPIVRSLNIKLKPELGEITPSQQQAFDVNGYNPEDWADAPSQKEGLLAISEFLQGLEAVIGQNVAFDLGFIKASLNRHDIKTRIPYHHLDLMTLSWVGLKAKGLKSLSLSKPGGVCDFLGVPITNAHTAMGDVELTRECWFRIQETVFTLEAPKVEPLPTRPMAAVMVACFLIMMILGALLGYGAVKACYPEDPMKAMDGKAPSGAFRD